MEFILIGSLLLITQFGSLFKEQCYVQIVTAWTAPSILVQIVLMVVAIGVGIQVVYLWCDFLSLFLTFSGSSSCVSSTNECDTGATDTCNEVTLTIVFAVVLVNSQFIKFVAEHNSHN
jgi:hypothetical protein